MATEVKPKSNRLLMLFGVLCALGAFGLALMLGKTSGGSIGGGGGPKNVPVVVATRDIPPATQLTTDMVTIQYFSADQQPPFAFKSKDLVIGKYSAITIHLNEPLSDNLLVASADKVQVTKQPYLDIPTGQVGMQIPTGELVGAGGYIQPEDRIDIIVTLGATTKTAFHNLRVLRVGPAGGQNTRGISSSLTVVVTLQQAEDLKFLIDNTNYRYVLKSVKDYDQPDPDTLGTDISTFKATYHLH